jgi:hypothetical protein
VDRQRFFRRADALLRVGGNAIVNQGLVLLVGDKDFEKLRSEIAVRIAGLFYYLGLMLRYSGWKATPDTRLPTVFVGGNGCRLLHWLTPPRYEASAEIHPLLARSMAAGAGLVIDDPQLQIEVSSEPKCEASCGMLFMGAKASLKVPDGVREAVVAGESFKSGSESYPATQILTAKLLAQNGGILAERASELAAFLKLYNQFAGSPDSYVFSLGNVDQVLQRGGDAIVDYCTSQKGRDLDAVQREPLFVKGMIEALRIAEWRPKH